MPPDTSDYLIAHSEMVQGSLHLSPQGEDRERINKAFDDLFEELKEREVLHYRDEEFENEQNQLTDFEKLCDKANKEINKQDLVANLQVGDVIFMESSLVYDFDKKDGNPVLKIMPDEYCKIVEIDESHIKYQGYSNPELLGAKIEREITCDIDNWKNELLNRNLKMISQKNVAVKENVIKQRKHKNIEERV